jgi:serine/threonine protein kinase
MDSRCNDACVSLQDEQQWQRERDAREKLKLDSRFVIQTLPAPSDDEFKSAVENLEGGLQGFVKEYLPEGTTLGHRVIVMEKADRNLLQIFQQERPNLNKIRGYVQEVLEALRHLHSKGLAHLDVKALNIVRLAVDNRLRLIDLDAAARIDHEVSEK